MSVDFSNVEFAGPDNAPVVVILGGISASRHVTATSANPLAGWWSDFVGPDRTIDTNRFRVLSIDYLTAGNNGEPLSTHDQAIALLSALDNAGVTRAAAIVGASYGGMVALAFATLAPDRVGHIVVIGAAHESAPLSSALRSLQRRIVELGVAAGRAHDALVIARGLAMTTYSTPEDFSYRFNSQSADPRVRQRLIVESLESSGETFARSCTPERFLAISQSLDLHAVRPEDVRVPATLIAVEEDALVPVSQVRELSDRLGAPCRLVELRSRHGHDTFLNAPELLAPFVALALSPSSFEVS